MEQVIIDIDQEFVTVVLQDNEIVDVFLNEGGLIVKKDGTKLGEFHAVNLIEGDNITLDTSVSGKQVNVTVNAQGGGSDLTFQDGLTEALGVVELGGVLTKNVEIALGASAALPKLLFERDAGAIQIIADNSVAGQYLTSILVAYRQISLRQFLANANELLDITLDFLSGTPRITVRGDGDFEGMKYHANYAANFTARSLVDKAYADTKLSPSDVSTNSDFTVDGTKLTDRATIRNAQELFESTGAEVAFDRPRRYGYPTAITGNITFSFTNAIEGMTQVMRHNDGTIPDLPASAKVLSGEYELSVNNYIYFVCILKGDTKEVHVTISQDLT